MIYLNNFLHYILQLTKVYPLYIIFFIIFFLELLIIFKLITKKVITKDLKIYNFHLNTLNIVIYFLIFIILLLILRYNRWGYFLNLSNIYSNFKNIYLLIPQILFYDIVLLIIIAIVLMLKFKSFLHREILKRYLYIYHEGLKNNQKNNAKTFYYYFNHICDKLSFGWTYDSFVEKIFTQIFIKPHSILFKKTSYNKLIAKSIRFLLKKFPFILLITFISFECLYNNFTLHYIFYYLPFYFFIHVWEIVSLFLKNTNSMANCILYEIYYEKNVMYLNTTDNEKEYFSQYISRNCTCLSNGVYDPDIYVMIEKKDLISNFPNIYMYNRRFVRISANNAFQNNSTGEKYYA